jgi:hypothetical protein
MIFPLAVSCWLLGGISPTAVDSAVDFPGRVERLKNKQPCAVATVSV